MEKEIQIKHTVSLYKGFEETASDFAYQVSSVIEQYNNVLEYAKEVTDRYERLLKAFDLILPEILHGDDEHKKWLKDKIESIRARALTKEEK